VTAARVDPPIALLAELTYRCPLRCGYCSNPRDLGRYADELSTADWQRVAREAASLGVLQFHLSGGEPLIRTDVEDIVHAARDAQLYTNLITSAYGLDAARVAALRDAGLDHVQISLQHVRAEAADVIAGTAAHEKKLRAARDVKSAGLALSINVVLHRGNLDAVAELIALADDLGAERIELANTQYHGWALANRDALLPTRAQLDRAAAAAEDARVRIGARMQILYVLPDYYTDAPKPCMGGWGRRFVTIVPDGTTLPCPGAHELPLAFDSVRQHSLREIWFESAGMNAYRGTGWMLEPCATCDQRTVDHGGCRCQSFELTGDARTADPACALSPAHSIVVAARERSVLSPPEMLYRVRASRAG